MGILDAPIPTRAELNATYATLDANGKQPIRKGDLVFNVKDYGNTATDFAGAVIAAIVAAAANGGGTVYIPPGTYDFLASSPISVPSGVTVRGAGSGSVTINQKNWTGDSVFKFSGTTSATVTLTADAPNNTAVISLTSTTGMVMGDLLLLGANEAPAGAVASNDGYRTEYVRIKSVDSSTQLTIWGRTAQAYTVAAAAGVKPTQSYARGVGLFGVTIVNPEPDQHFANFVYFENCRDVAVSDVVGRGCDSTGIVMRNVYGFSITNVHLSDQPDRVDVDPKRFGYGIATYAATEQGRIIGCTFSRMRHGFTTTGLQNQWGQTRNIVVSGCTGTENTNAMFDTHAGAVNVLFEGNAVSNTTSAAFQLRGIANGVIGNMVDSVSTGVFITQNALGSKIKGNVFRNVGGWSTTGGTQTEYPPSATGGGHGIVIHGATNVSITDNEFENLTRTGIYIDGQGSATLSRLYIRDNKFANIGRSGSSRAVVWVETSVTSISEVYVQHNLAVAYASATAEPDSTGAIDDFVTFATAAGNVGTFYILDNTIFNLGFGVTGGTGSSSTNILVRNNKVLGAGTYTEQVSALMVNGTLSMAEAQNLVLGTSTGTKIGTANTQKFAFWGANPVTQRTLTYSRDTETAAGAAIRSMLTTIGIVADNTTATDPSAALSPVNANKLTLDLIQAKALVYPWLVGDSFARTNAASLGTADTGQAWTADAGAFQIVNKAATPTTTTNTRSTLDTGAVDHWASVRIDSVPNAAQQWVICRFVDSSNYYRFGYDGANFALQKVVSGSVTVLATISGVATNVAGTTISLQCLGTALTAYINNVQVGSVTDSALSTGTKAGVQSNNVAAVLRSFTVRAS